MLDLCDQVISKFCSFSIDRIYISLEILIYRSDDELHTNTEHHRKRHEEVDCCPEEIKLMKVACEELSLECSSQNSPALPPKFPDQKLDQKSVATTIVSSNQQATTPASNERCLEFGNMNYISLLFNRGRGGKN